MSESELGVIGPKRFRVVVYGKPQQRGSKNPVVVRRKGGEIVTGKNGQPIINTKDANPESTEWMRQVKQAAGEQFAGYAPVHGAIILSAAFYFERPKSHYGTGRNEGVVKDSSPKHHIQSPDLSKLTRAIEDALTGVIYFDDKQIIGYDNEHRKHWTESMARVEITVHTEYEMKKAVAKPKPKSAKPKGAPF